MTDDALSAIATGTNAAPLSPEQRAWCLAELSPFGDDTLAGATDAILAQAVLADHAAFFQAFGFAP